MAHAACDLFGDQREEGVLQARVALAGLDPQLVERALRDQPAAGDDADAVGHALGDFEDVRGHDHGAAGRDPLAQHVLDLPRRAGVEAGQRLVEDDQPRVVDQRAGERHLLPHALGEALAALVRVRREPEPADQVVGALLGHRRLDAPEAGDEFEIFERRELVVDHRLVGDPGHDPLGLDRIGERVDAEHRDRAGVGLEQARDHAQASWSCRRRSARAGRRTRPCAR